MRSLTAIRAPEAHEALFAGRYRVDQLLHRGDLAEVHAATDLERRCPVVLKLAVRDPWREGPASRRLLREARIMVAVPHAHVAAVHDHGRSPEGTAFLVLERVPGPTLREFVAQRASIPAQTVVALALQIALALAAAHARGIVHGSLSSSKVLLAPADRNGLMCKLIGFGHAPPAPRGTVVDTRPDLRALGAILGEVLDRTPHPPAELLALWRSLRSPELRSRSPGAAAVVGALRAIDSRRSSTRPLSPVAWGVTGLAVLLVLGALMAS